MQDMSQFIAWNVAILVTYPAKKAESKRPAWICL